MKKLFAIIRSSILLRLILIFFIAGILLISALGLILRGSFKSHFRENFLNHIGNYSEYIIKDIGTPPDTARARMLSGKLEIDFGIVGEGIYWFSTPLPLDLSELRLKKVIGEKFSLYGSKEIWVTSVPKGDYEFYFYHEKQKERMLSPGSRALIVFIVIFVLLLSYLMVRYLFKPITWVKEGARRIGEGDFDHRLPENRSDELGQLSSSINSMATRIKNMLEAKRQLLLAISHELRSPLARAKVSQAFIKDEKVRGNINDDLDEMESLLATLLESEKSDQPHLALAKQKVNIGEWLEGNLGELYPDAQADFKTSIPEEDSEVNMDPLRMRLVLKNLLQNAKRHTPGDKLPIEVSVSLKRRIFTLEVTDKGEGIAPEHLEKITEPFYRADSSRTRKTGGHGLGLYLCKHIAESHGGTLAVKSEVGVGTTVTIMVPGRG